MKYELRLNLRIRSKGKSTGQLEKEIMTGEHVCDGWGCQGDLWCCCFRPAVISELPTNACVALLPFHDHVVYIAKDFSAIPESAVWTQTFLSDPDRFLGAL